MGNAPAKGYIAALDKMHKDIQKYLAAANDEMVAELLVKCQNYAIQFGTMMEKRMGEKATTVGYLEEYCEVVYHMYEELTQENKRGQESIYEVLDTQLSTISESVKKDVDIHIEAVFLPFKVNTWDALESVWQAADNDPDCDAYVVPIPYYDKNPDGTFGKMHYEADGFPPDVPVTFYESYDFAGRRPDMIFIQNPYDGRNYTTSVHPFFYSDNLKQFTENLIYIPWFIVDEIDEEDEQGMQSMQDFAAMPGVINADKVIVQSEQMRQAYIGILAKSAGDDAKAIWEEKILGVGSPLYDKAAGIPKKEDVIPREWLDLLYKPDGSRKKVILYGTSISRLLQYKEPMLEKMRSVFKIFGENREDIVPIWMPEDTVWMKDMVDAAERGLMQSYWALVEQYKAQGWGIYDDSEDLCRAAALADACYGDACRVMQVCRKAGIPMMVQDINIR